MVSLFKPDSRVDPRWMKTYSESRIELWNLQILKKMLGKIKSVFVIKAALWAEKLGHCLENNRSWKNTLEKLVVVVNLEAIWFEFWMKGSSVTCGVLYIRNYFQRASC